MKNKHRIKQGLSLLLAGGILYGLSYEMKNTLATAYSKRTILLIPFH